ncbi:MAG: hypothetical protein NZ765_00990 [Anaerolineae bacterium]|nr:hypothetical protein [Anaerolineae bacterium]MDW8070452.1 hypothetical protein [Anaerolineae bacterium]
MTVEDWLSPECLEQDAIYLGVLTAWGVKPLSRLEYPVRPWVWASLRHMALVTARLTRYAENGAWVEHWVFSRYAHLVERYCRQFDRQPLNGDSACLVRLEADYFGYPQCCAEEYLRSPDVPSDLLPADQALLFHRACTGCQVTPQLLPWYRAALVEARALCDRYASRNRWPSAK